MTRCGHETTTPVRIETKPFKTQTQQISSHPLQRGFSLQVVTSAIGFSDCYIRVDQQNSLHRRFGDVCPTVRGSWRPVYFDGRVSHMDLFQTFGIHARRTQSYRSFQGVIFFSASMIYIMTEAVWRGSDIHRRRPHHSYVSQSPASHVESIVAADVAAMLAMLPGHGVLAAL
jgi:hypothetical protein